jgi:hypothetical protein
MRLALFACVTLSCFPILMKLRTFPAPSSVFRQFFNERTGVNIPFRNIEEIPGIIQCWRSMIGNLTVVSARLPVVVAVDAMSLNPGLAIQKGETTNRVLGAVDTIEVSDSQIIEYSASLCEFENWGKTNSHNRITDIFVFLLQPLDLCLLCTLLYLLSATSGKASDETVRILLRIREGL